MKYTSQESMNKWRIQEHEEEGEKTCPQKLFHETVNKKTLFQKAFMYS